MGLARQDVELLSEQLKAFSAVNVDSQTAATCLERALQTYGPVTRTAFRSLHDGIRYILPIKSLITRWLVLGGGDWSLLISDMRGESCHVDGYAISRATGCNALGLVLKDERRELHVYESGVKVREVQSLRDGDRWYYREQGDRQPFEDPGECRARKQRDRLRVRALRAYFQRYTKLAFPDWSHASFDQIFALQRSTHEVRNPIEEFDTLVDLDL